MGRAALPGALVLSGLAAVAVEVLWQRILARLLGGSTAALTAVLAAYMGGLALGAGLAGRRGDRLEPRAALSGYVRLEIVVWIAASLTTVALSATPADIGGALAAVPEGVPRFIARLLAAIVILMIPTTAMGATLPLAVRAAVGRSQGGLLRSASVLYAANTAGAVVGALVGPLVLLPTLGLRASALVAASGSLLAALLARLYTPPVDELEARAQDPPAPRERAATVARWVPAATFASGAAALGLEVIWTRLLGTMAGSSVYAFAAVLALFLAGMALGSGAVAAVGPRIRQPALAFAFVVTLAPTLAVVLLPVLEQLPERYVALASTGELTLGASLWLLLLVGSAVIVPSAICFGAALPLAIRAVRTEPSRSTAGAVGRVYVANTAGAIAGAAATGLLLVPTIGPGRTALALAALVLIAATAFVLRDAAGTRRQRALLVGLAAVAALALAVVRTPDARSAAAAVHIRAVDLARVRGVDSLSHPRRLYFAEGPEASVLVESVSGNRTFYVAGRPEASNAPLDLRNQYLLGHLPALAAGGARRSLVIGLGSGMTAGALLLHGHVTVAELNRAVPGATRTFSDLNHDVVRRAEIRIEDGRMLLAARGPRFDVITTDPIHPYVAGSIALYSTEHLQLSRSRLRPRGAVSQWLPLHQMGRRELRGIIGSFLDVFPDAELYLSGADSILVGGGRPGDRLAQFRDGWTEGVARDMRLALIGSPEELLALRVAGPRQLERFVRDCRRNLDDDPWIELSLPRFIYANTVPENASDLLALRPDEESRTPLARAHAALQRSHHYWGRGQGARALEVLERVAVDGPAPSLELSVRLRELTAQRAHDALKGGNRRTAMKLARRERDHADATVSSLLVVAEVFRNLNLWDDLDETARRLSQRFPDSPEGPFVAGESLSARGRFAEAIPRLERSLALDRTHGLDWLILPILARSYLIAGQSEKGRNMLRRAIPLRPDQPELADLLGASPEAIEKRVRRFELQSR